MEEQRQHGYFGIDHSTTAKLSEEQVEYLKKAEVLMKVALAGKTKLDIRYVHIDLIAHPVNLLWEKPLGMVIACFGIDIDGEIKKLMTYNKANLEALMTSSRFRNSIADSILYMTRKEIERKKK